MDLMYCKNLESLILTVLENEGNLTQLTGHYFGEQENAVITHLKYDREFEKNSLDSLVGHLRGATDVVSVFDDKRMNTGYGNDRGIPVSLETLAKWLVVKSQESGVKDAIGLLSKYLDLDYSPAIAILAISGIDPIERISISDSIDLVPFDELPPSLPKEALFPIFMQKAFREKDPIYNLAFIASNLGARYRLPKAALVKNVAIFPKSYQDGDSVTSPINFLDLYEACEFLTLFRGATPVPVGSWVELDSSVPCKQMVDFLWDPFPTTWAGRNVVINSNDWSKLNVTYKSFLRMTQANKDLLRIPIQRINQARRRNNIADKAIDQGIAFEALFLNDNKEQISFTFRLRASLLLGEDYEQRKKLIDFFKEFYSCRSQATHTGKLDHIRKISNRGKLETRELLNESDELCIKAINKIIDIGEFPDWDKVLLMVGLNT